MSNRIKIKGVLVATAAASMVSLGLAAPALANHPVFVEGNCLGRGMVAPGLQTSAVPAGTCGDYDGDGKIGTAEDADGDNNYGSIGAAVTAVANNGKVTIVANGTFAETVTLAPTAGANITLEGAPGVDANIDAVVQGDPGSVGRQLAPGVIINGADDTRVTVRNIMTRNWTEGVVVNGQSHATLDQVRAENNITYGILVRDSAKVAISEADVSASGFRKNTGGVSTPKPGVGIEFEDSATGSIWKSVVTGSKSAGVSYDKQAVEIFEVQSFDNRPNFKRTLGRR